MLTYLREARQEIRKVSWPTREELRVHTIAVVVVSTLVALYFGLIDWAFNLGFQALMSLTA
jgi:preprotein translocase subunit SecE